MSERHAKDPEVMIQPRFDCHDTPMHVELSKSWTYVYEKKQNTNLGVLSLFLFNTLIYTEI